uniref:Protein aurora borealis n=1 Tax=Rhabditophanes sp. KR3021 TaxID=114890 RepID=A0AC35TKN0_9BILA
MFEFKVDDSGSEGSRFKWSIDHISKMNPTVINEDFICQHQNSARNIVQRNPRLRERTQAYFNHRHRVPSPEDAITGKCTTPKTSRRGSISICDWADKVGLRRTRSEMSLSGVDEEYGTSPVEISSELLKMMVPVKLDAHCRENFLPEMCMNLVLEFPDEVKSQIADRSIEGLIEDIGLDEVTIPQMTGIFVRDSCLDTFFGESFESESNLEDLDYSGFSTGSGSRKRMDLNFSPIRSDSPDRLNANVSPIFGFEKDGNL